MLARTLLAAAIWPALVLGHNKASQKQDPLSGDIDRSSRWQSGYTFSGIQTFAHLPHVQCLVEQDAPFDLAVIGVPFDTAVGYRPGRYHFPMNCRRSSECCILMAG